VELSFRISSLARLKTITVEMVAFLPRHGEAVGRAGHLFTLAMFKLLRSGNEEQRRLEIDEWDL
jgi:hypothetical protein